MPVVVALSIIAEEQLRSCNGSPPLSRAEHSRICNALPYRGMTNEELYKRLDCILAKLRRRRDFRRRHKASNFEFGSFLARRQAADAAAFDRICKKTVTGAASLSAASLRVLHPLAERSLSDSEYQIARAQWRQYVALNSTATRRDLYNPQPRTGGYRVTCNP